MAIMACVALMPILNTVILLNEMCRRTKPEFAEMEEPKLPEFDNSKHKKEPKKVEDDIKEDFKKKRRRKESII